MIDFDIALDDCLTRLANGTATVDDCLRLYPEHAAELRRTLAAASTLERGRAVRPSDSFKADARARLVAHMKANPRRRAQPGAALGWALRFGLAALAVAIASVSAAQAALPGNPLYSLKLVTESVWRMAQSNPLASDLALADRRAAEVAQTPPRSPAAQLALQGYERALAQLARYTSTADRATIMNVLAAQKEMLSRVDVVVPALEQWIAVTPPATSVAPAPVVTSLPTLPAVVIPTVAGQPTVTAPVPALLTVLPTLTPLPLVATRTLVPPVIVTALPTALPGNPLPTLPPLPTISPP